MKRIVLTGAALAASLALAGCGDPQPGLEDEARVEKVATCRDAIGHFAPTEAKKDQLCQCTTARLAQERLTIADLSGAKRDRAMEQLRWCLAQVGLGPKQKAAPAPVDDTVETEEPAGEATAAAEGTEAGQPVQE